MEIKETSQNNEEAIREKAKEIQTAFNANHNELEGYLQKISDVVLDMEKNGNFTLMDTYRVVSYLLARITSSAYIASEVEFNIEARRAQRLVQRFFTDLLKMGQPEAAPEDFKISRLMLFSAALIDEAMWRVFVLNYDSSEEGENPEPSTTGEE